jgi:hypothetical protein
MIHRRAIVVLTLLLAMALVSCSNKSTPTLQSRRSSVQQPSAPSATRDSADQSSAPPVAAQEQPCIPMESIFMDLSCGASFAFTIAPNLPQFTFKMIPEVREAASGFPASPVRDIEVFRGSSTDPSQSLTGCDLRLMEPPPRAATDPSWFHAEDVNFDGFQDIYLMMSKGATGNQDVCMWLYDPEIGRFEYSKEFSQLGRHWLDAATKSIFVFGTGGMASTVYNARKYDVEGNLPVLIYTEIQDYDNGKKLYHCVIQEQRGNAMATVRDELAEAPPCDAEQLMRQYVYPRRITSPGTTVRVIG